MVVQFMDTTSNITITMLPIWSEEIIASLIIGSVTEQQRNEFLSNLRNARLAEVDQIEKILEMEITTAEMRRSYTAMIRRIRYLEQELKKEKLKNDPKDSS